MPQSLTSILVHIIFSTKDRNPFIKTKISKNLYRYMISVARAYNSSIIEIGGTEDHIHILSILPKTLALSKLVEELKKSSSKWMKTQGAWYRNFAWQSGYGAFSISQSNISVLIKYIRNQQKHHEKITFQDEYRLFLERYRVSFNEKYAWG